MTIGLYILMALYAFIIGLCFGSFLNAWTWRIAHGESVARGRSHCTNCGHTLGARDLVPVFSWLSTKGKCRYCKKPISARYPITEIVCGLLFASVALRFGLSIETLQMTFLVAILFLITLTDIDDYLIPNAAVITGIIGGFIFAGIIGYLNGNLGETLLTALIGGVSVAGALLIFVLIADKIAQRSTMGGGDIKLLAMTGIYVGWTGNALVLIVASVLGIIGAAVLGRPKLNPDGTLQEDNGFIRRVIPFGPYIAVATWLVVLFGTPVITWYLGLLS